MQEPRPTVIVEATSSENVSSIKSNRFGITPPSAISGASGFLPETIRGLHAQAVVSFKGA
jgi:hypothetical protein